MKPAIDNKKRPRRQEDPHARVRRQASYIRLLEFVVAAIILSAGIYWKLYPELYMLMVALLLAYPLIAQSIAFMLERKGRRQQEASRILVQVDAVLIGTTIAALHFALIPSLALLIIVHANAVTSGGIRPWLLNILLTGAGCGIGMVIFGMQVTPPEATPVLLNLLSMVGLGIYVGGSSLYALNQTRNVRMAQAYMARQQKQAVDLSRKLAKYLPPQIWGQLFSGKRDAKLETRRKRLTVFFSDIKGFSNISEDLPLDKLTGLLNSYLNEMTRIALRYGGTIDKFIGDAVMVFFGDPVSRGSKEDAFNCVAMAVEMQRQMKLLRQRWQREGITQKLEIRIGINSGYVTVGNFGAESRMDYTILGTDVNLASRLESQARAGRILISQATYELVKDRVICRNMGDIEVKGFNRPIPVYEVQELKADAAGRDKFVSVQTEGFGLHLDVRRIRNFDRDRLLRALAGAARDLRTRDAVQVDTEAEGFSLHLDSTRLRQKDVGRVIEIMGKAAQRIKKEVVL
ncbi:adenylate cyclase [Alcanivorax sp. JB21]|uniref:adenylate/guanylate cyclase domain-containing protein n=1 Tax=Alcanivorax limicola TaxID=2874102 RepID=UPI001CBD047A|nr:adenylate/guanylate cyclase domain-containing protein [Alcanivorax limicola]MBZ2189981.1 adenylate cyclase [Alcanivorax limicola]